MAPHRAGKPIAPGRKGPWKGAALEIRWIDHAWFQIKVGGITIHIDPSILGSKRLKELAMGVEKADLVLITHHHADHCRKEAVGLVSEEGGRVVAPQVCAEKLGSGMVTINPGGTFRFSGAVVQAVDAYNTAEGASTVKAHKKGECLGYLLKAGGKTVYHAGDTDLIPEMRTLGSIDVALLPIGGTYTMNASEAAEAVILINPKIVVPMHHMDADPGDFARRVGNKSRVVVMAPGATIKVA